MSKGPGPYTVQFNEPQRDMIAQLFALVDESRVVKISDGVNDADATYRMLKEAFAALPDDDAAIHKRYGEEHALNCIHGFAI